jgi:hypothetical protein
VLRSAVVGLLARARRDRRPVDRSAVRQRDRGREHQRPQARHHRHIPARSPHLPTLRPADTAVTGRADRWLTTREDAERHPYRAGRIVDSIADLLPGLDG